MIVTIRAQVLAAFAIAASVNPIWAADGDRMVYGAGLVTCGEWQQYRSTGNRPAILQLQAWIDGFLVGYNTASGGKDFIAPKPETVAYYAWIDNYCGQKPLNQVIEAVLALKNELTARAH